MTCARRDGGSGRSRWPPPSFLFCVTAWTRQHLGHRFPVDDLIYAKSRASIGAVTHRADRTACKRFPEHEPGRLRVGDHPDPLVEGTAPMPPTIPAVMPEDVTDVLLWRLAIRVAADHQPDPCHPGQCANLRCAREAYPCPPLRDAQRAQGAATRPQRFTPGRARVSGVAAVAHRFVGWFRPARLTPPAASPASSPLPQRQPMAALRLAV
jgi:hypothetical protein